MTFSRPSFPREQAYKTAQATTVDETYHGRTFFAVHRNHGRIDCLIINNIAYLSRPGAHARLGVTGESSFDNSRGIQTSGSGGAEARAARRLEAGLSRPGRALARAGLGLSRTGRDGAGRERAGDGAGVARSLCRAEPASGRAAGGGLGRITDQTEARAEDRVRRVDGGRARARGAAGWASLGGERDARGSPERGPRAGS